MTLRAVEMEHTHVAACVAILNPIIATGGSTAYEEPFTETYFTEHYLLEPPVRTVVMLGERVVGFQSAFDCGDGTYSIGSFTDQVNPVRGAGRVMFSRTVDACRKHGGHAIFAKITSDNSGGVAYYTKMGFADWKVIPNDHTRRDGTTVDRIIKRYML